MRNLNSFNAKLNHHLTDIRFLYLLWMILNKKNLLEEIDYRFFDKQSIRTKAIMLSDVMLENLINNMIDSNAMHIFHRPDNRKYQFIRKKLTKHHDNKETQTPPDARQQDILFAIFDSLPIHHENKLALLESIETDWNKNTTPDELFNWYKEDFPLKKKFTINKIKRDIKTENNLPECNNFIAIRNEFDLIAKDYRDRITLINNIKKAYSIQRSKLKNQQALLDQGVKLIGVNIKIPTEQHEKFELIKKKLNKNQPEAFCEIIEYYWINNPSVDLGDL
ncbi:hypothetical protein ACFPAG_16560 [Vogesella sp. GCM10023246]|uniref:DUF4423 domain-containing protein n=1 Tax=Vogesella oryzagri TaxID=3160864 RepID=A0ABV1M7P7_9NEIS